MKKVALFIIMIASFFFFSIHDVVAQWSVNVYYDTTNCDCGIVTDRTIEWELKDLVTQGIISSGSEDVDGYPHELGGEETILYDAEQRYRLYVRITYTDSSECCDGWNSHTYDGDELVDGADFGLTMN